MLILELEFCPLWWKRLIFREFRQLCKNSVGDYIECEFHLLCECVHYTSLRLSLFRKVTRKWPEFGNLDLFDKFIFLNENAQMYTANFVALAMEIRKTRLYHTST